MDIAAHRALAALAAETALDMLTLMMALRVLRLPVRPARVLFAAFFASTAVIAAKRMRLSQPAALALTLPLAMCMMRMSGGGRSLRAMVRATAVLLACAGFLGGTVLALYGAAGSLAAAYAMSGGVSAAVFVGMLRAARTAADVRRVRVVCVIGGQRLTIDGIADSGNSLRDYLTQRPVIVASAALMRAGMRSRPIFADTAGGRQMMQLAMPEDTFIVLEGRQVRVRAALAFSPGLMGDAPALVPVSLLQKEDMVDS